MYMWLRMRVECTEENLVEALLSSSQKFQDVSIRLWLFLTVNFLSVSKFIDLSRRDVNNL